jgi:hypothetical protein
MADAAEPVADAPAENEADEEQSVTELLEQLARELSALALYEARLAASRHEPAVRRTARDLVAAGAAVLAFLTAFALANAAAVRALSAAMPDWLAPLVLAAAWVVIGALLALFLRGRAKRFRVWDVEDADEARDEAERAVRETLERLSPAITREIALAAIPAAGDMAGGVIDASDEILESADEMMDAITADVPGGGVVNQMWDVVLMPGRFGVRVATTVLKRSNSGS